MIASLRGTLVLRDTGSCVIETGGVGYRVHVSTWTAETLPPPGLPVFVHTRQIVREDSLALFGFADTQELRLFDLLINVSGVGPRLALAVVSGLRPDALTRAIRDENVGALVAIQGVGRKTAERLVVELRDKLDAISVGTATSAPRGKGVLPKSERFDDAIAALASLGYTAAQSREAVQRATEGASDLSLEQIVRKSLATLGKSAVSAR
jgi:holliday junction DNA helicase RuvA